MSQQFAIAVVIDVGAALSANTLEDNIYLFDNMKLQGSEGQGTGDLVTAINGAHWFDGSQAELQILNWMLLGLGPFSKDVPKTLHADRARAVESKQGLKANANSTLGIESAKDGQAEESIHDTGYFYPIITDITGEAVDKGVMHPAQYGSPDLATDGWYWSAAVDTTKPGTYSYTMQILLYKPRLVNGGNVWEPVYMKHQSRIKITSEPKINGFTNEGIGFIPIV